VRGGRFGPAHGLGVAHHGPPRDATLGVELVDAFLQPGCASTSPSAPSVIIVWDVPRVAVTTFVPLYQIRRRVNDRAALESRRHHDVENGAALCEWP